jgi:hypothetical protein
MKINALLLAVAFLPSAASAQSVYSTGFTFSLGATLGGIPIPKKVVKAVADGMGDVLEANATIDFTCAAVSQDAKTTAACLKKVGITVKDVTPGSKIAFVDNKDVYEGKAADPVSGRMLMQLEKNEAVSYTLAFEGDIEKVVFSRPKLKATEASGITHPKWKATAYDAAGKVLSSVGEERIGSYKDVPSKAFVLDGPKIASVKFESDGGGKTAFSAVLIEKLEAQSPAQAK